jgi:hypothetical protein
MDLEARKRELHETIDHLAQLGPRNKHWRAAKRLLQASGEYMKAIRQEDLLAGQISSSSELTADDDLGPTPQELLHVMVTEALYHRFTRLRGHASELWLRRQIRELDG